ncbi:MAG: ABC transporter ATP-binding protein, partial [Atribacterota bacterium]|nr:ABC transporter ATP-binding protein [Atribacterota bacterium]
MATLVLEKLNLWYGKHTHAVQDVDLTVEDGELCVFLGPSGCGKTSTLRMIAGFLKPTSGKIYLDGEVINDLYPGDRNVAMIFQSYALYPHMPVREQLAFPLRAKGKLSKGEIEKRIQETAAFLHLQELMERYP